MGAQAEPRLDQYYSGGVAQQIMDWVSGSLLFYADATDASVRAKAAAAFAAGGGIVVLPPVTITLLSPLPLLNGVKYQGTGWGPNFNSNGSNDLSKTSGTILQGNGTFAAFAGNTTASGAAPTNFITFINGDGTATNPGMIRGCGVTDLTLYNFTYGVQVGAKYTPGCQYAHFERLNLIYCNQWPVSLENGAENTIREININYPQTFTGNTPAIGCIYIGASGGNLMYTGNLTIDNIYIYRTSYLTRGIVFEARGTVSTRNNLIQVGKCYVQGSTTTEVTSAVSSVSGTSITVGNGALFQVGMPVVTDTTAGGFTAGVIYYVSSIAGNVLTLSYTLDGAAVSATGLTGNIKTYGWPKIELNGRIEGGVTNYVNAIRFTALDLGETTASCDVSMQNASFNNFDILHTAPPYPAGAGAIQSYFTFAARVSNNNGIRCPEAFTYDLDTSSSRNDMSGGTNTFSATTMGIGLRQILSTGTPAVQFTGALYLSGYNAGGPDIYINTDTAGVTLYRSLTLGHDERRNADAPPKSLFSAQGYYATANGGWTLPPLTDNMVGMVIFASNPTAFTMTLTTSGETVNGSGTTFVVAANSMAVCVAQKAAGVRYWGIR